MEKPADFISGINSETATYLWVAALSLWGGIVSYFDKMQVFSWVRLFAHLMSSSFAGMMTFMLCQSANIHGPMAGVLCGVAAHMGTTALIRLLMKNPTIKQFFEESK
jgi:hypothetical protein